MITERIDTPRESVIDQRTPTPAREWSKAHLYTLPSGNIARLKRPSVLALASNGYNPVSAKVMLDMYTAKEQPKTDEEKIAQIKSNSQRYLEVAALAMVEPRLILDREPDYDGGEIGPGDLSDVDLLWLYWTFVEGDAKALANFRIE